MARHLGLHISRIWTLAVMEDLDAPGAPRSNPLSNPLKPVTIRTSTGVLSAAAAWAKVGLTAASIEVPEELYVGSHDGQVCVLPGNGGAPTDASVGWTTWDALAHRLPHDPCVAQCAAHFLAALLVRFEDATGRRATPFDSITLVFDGGGHASLPRHLSSACAAALGIPATTLWQPTAIAGWALSLTTVQGALLRGREVVVAVGPGAAIPVRIAQDSQTGIRTEMIDRASPAPAAAARVEPGSAPAAQVAACGGALWGWWRHTSRAHAHTDHARPTFALLAPDGKQPVPLHPIVDPTDAPPDAAVRAEKAAPPAEVEHPNKPLATPLRQWFARGFGVPAGNDAPVPLTVVAVFPWATRPLTVAEFIFPFEDLHGRWRNRMAVAVGYDSEPGVGQVMVLFPSSTGGYAKSFELLSTAAPVDRSVGRAAPDLPRLSRSNLEAGLAQSASLPVMALEADVATDSMLVLSGHGAGGLGSNAATTVTLLAFWNDPLPLEITTNRADLPVPLPKAGTRIAPGLTRYQLDICEAGSPLAGEVRWRASVVQLTRAGKRRKRAKTAVLPLVEGVLTLWPAGYGLEGYLSWGKDATTEPTKGSQADPWDYPLPLAGPLGEEAATALVPARPALTGALVSAARDRVLAAVPVDGALHLLNSGSLTLRLHLSAGPGLRVWDQTLTLAPAASVSIPLQRRLTLAPEYIDACRLAEVQCWVQPLVSETPPTHDRVTGAPLQRQDPRPVSWAVAEPPVPISIRATPSKAGAGTLCISPRGVINWARLPSWLPMGNWQLQMRVNGLSPVELKLGPDDAPQGPEGNGHAADGDGNGKAVASGKDGRSGKEVAGRPAASAEARESGRLVASGAGGNGDKANGRNGSDPKLHSSPPVSAWVSPAASTDGADRRALLTVLGQPAMLLDWFPGPMERVEGTLALIHPGSASRPGGVSVPLAVRAAIQGVICGYRRIDLTVEAGRPFAIPVQLLVSAGLQVKEARWQWRSGGGPYEVTAALRETPSDAELPLEFTPRPLAAQAIKANPKALRQYELRVEPNSPTGWESSEVTATLSFHGANGQILDEIPIGYVAQTCRPTVTVAIVRTPGRRLRCDVTIANTNPFQPLAIKNLRLKAVLKVLAFHRPIPVELPPGQEVERVPIRGSRTWLGRVVHKEGWWSWLTRKLIRSVALEVHLEVVDDGGEVLHAFDYSFAGLRPVSRSETQGESV